MIYQDITDPSMVVAKSIREYLTSENLNITLPNLSYEVLALQLRDSSKRTEYIRIINNRDISSRRVDPNDPLFDPIKAIVYLKRIGEYDEACWLTFLLIYTAENYQSKWKFIKEIYIGGGDKLTWKAVNNDIDIVYKKADSIKKINPKIKFGGHRPYESLNHLPIVFENYIDLINNNGGHKNLFFPEDRKDPRKNFQDIYNSIRKHIFRFGRLSTFDYLCMLNKMNLANIEADCCYIADSTGPKRGAELIFGKLSKNKLDMHSKALAEHLEFSYQEMEDALCN